MVGNFRPGPDWTPGMVDQVMGPVTYLVKLPNGQSWKRHTDQIRSWTAPPSSVPTEVEVSAEEDSFIPGDYEQVSDGSDSVTLEQEAPGHISEREAAPAPTDMASTVPVAGPDRSVLSTSTPNTASAPIRRYPLRNRKPRKCFEPRRN